MGTLFNIQQTGTNIFKDFLYFDFFRTNNEPLGRFKYALRQPEEMARTRALKNFFGPYRALHFAAESESESQAYSVG